MRRESPVPGGEHPVPGKSVLSQGQASHPRGACSVPGGEQGVGAEARGRASSFAGLREGEGPGPGAVPAHLTPALPTEASSRPWSTLTFSPARLVVPEGANATFTCSFSSKPEHFVLNWYRMSPSNQTDKLAAFPEDRSQPGRDQRFRVTPLPGGQHFLMNIVAAQRNDSGVYFCGAIYLPPRTQINESHPAELTVTGVGTGDPSAGQAPGLGWEPPRQGGLGVARLRVGPRSHTQDRGDPHPCLPRLEAPPDPLSLRTGAGGRASEGDLVLGSPAQGQAWRPRVGA